MGHVVVQEFSTSCKRGCLGTRRNLIQSWPEAFQHFAINDSNTWHKLGWVSWEIFWYMPRNVKGTDAIVNHLFKQIFQVLSWFYASREVDWILAFNILKLSHGRNISNIAVWNCITDWIVHGGLPIPEVSILKNLKMETCNSWLSLCKIHDWTGTKAPIPSTGHRTNSSDIQSLVGDKSVVQGVMLIACHGLGNGTNWMSKKIHKKI